jgi:hypothetical protein
MPAPSPRTARAARPTTRAVAAVALVLVAVGGGSTASAYWSEPGGGTGAAATGTTTAVTLMPGVVTGSLHPGGTGDVSAVASNPDTGATVVEALELDPTQGEQGLAVDTDHPGCPTTAFTFAVAAGSAGWTVPGRSGAEDGRLAITLPHALQLAADAPNGCQGATVTVFLRSA